jgi:toxin-antitoxin system PIN domain toxin
VVVVDTNVLVYAADADSPFHGPCRSWLENRRARAEAWYCTWPIVYEFLRVTTHPRVLHRPWKNAESWSFIEALLETPGLGMLVPGMHHAAVAGEVLRELPHLAGNILHDAHTAIVMREHGVRQVCTRDTDFHRFPFLEVIDPVAG